MSRYSAAALDCFCSSPEACWLDSRSTAASCSSSPTSCLLSRSEVRARSSLSRASLSSCSEAPSTRLLLALPSSTLRTRIAKLSEQSDSGAESELGPMLTNMNVLLEPPSESASRWVSFELRKGMCLDFSCSAAITSPMAERLLLMFCASVIAWPETSLFLTRSEPARSTRLSLPCVLAPEAACRPVTLTMTIECERDEAEFILVAVTERRAAPRSMALSTSVAVSTLTVERPGTCTGWPGTWRMSSDAGFFSPPFWPRGVTGSTSRSRRFSL